MEYQAGLETFETDLPEIGYADGFLYLFDLFSHLTQSRRLFGHKIAILIRLSRETQKSHFTRAEMGSIFPQYDPKHLDSMLNSLMDGKWLIRGEGTLSYSISKTGLLFLRFLPFLYRGDEMDEMAFQLAVVEMLEAAEKMDVGLPSLELMRDQILNAVQRNITDLKAALISRNDERIRTIIHSIRDFLVDVKDVIQRIAEITRYKQQKGMELSEGDKYGIETLLSFNTNVMNLYNERKQYYLDHKLMGQSVYTKSDVDRLLSRTTFLEMIGWISGNLATPSGSFWVDEYDLSVSLDAFLERDKPARKSRGISRKSRVEKESLQSLFGESPYSEKLRDALLAHFQSIPRLSLEQFLAPYNQKVDGLMFLAALSSLENQRHLWRETNFAGYLLDTKPSTTSPEVHLFRRLSEAIIERKENTI